MKQPHTEETIRHTDDQQNTGNHKTPGAADATGADQFGGTRAGAESVEGDAKPTLSGQLAGARLGSEDVEQSLNTSNAEPAERPATTTRNLERPT